jgi:PAS domain S-box-containing protein
MNNIVMEHLMDKEFYNALIIERAQSSFPKVLKIVDQLKEKVNFSKITSIKFTEDFAPIYLKINETQSDIVILCYDNDHNDTIEFIKQLKAEEQLISVLVVSSSPVADVAAELMKLPNVDYSSMEGLDDNRFFKALEFFRKNQKYHYLLDLLRTENKKLWQIIKQNPVSILITEAKKNSIEFVNYNFTNLTGYTLYEVLGKQPNFLSSGETTKGLHRIMWETLNIGKVWKGEIQNRKKDGSIYWSYTAISPLYNEKNELTHYVAIYDDITDSKLADEKLKTYTNALKQKSDQLEQLNNQMNDNLNKALRLHRHFFPREMPELSGYKIAAYYQPANTIGGDFYNMIPYKKQFLFYLVDVSGKGIDGAFINIFVRQKVNRFLYLKNKDKETLCPKEIIEFIAKEYKEENFPDEYFICLFIGVIDLDSNQIEYCNSGIQVPPIIASQNDLITLDIGGLPISSAIDGELLVYEKGQLRFPPEATLVLTSDGIIEEYESEEIYGIERFHALVKDNYFLEPNILKEKMIMSIQQFLKGKNNEDDHTFIIIQREFDVIYSKPFILESNVDSVQVFGDQISDLIMNLDCHIQNKDLIIFGVFEMVYNALEHGNCFNREKKIHINFTVYKNHFVLSIEDEGEGFDWLKMIRREVEILNANERGRGIFLAKRCFDFISYNEKGNKVSLYAKFMK